MDLPFVLKLRIPATVSVPVSEDRFWPISALHDRQLSASRVRSKASRELGAFSTGAGIYPARSTEGDSYSC